MKEFRYHISLYIIVPIIFSGFATLSSILIFQLTQYCYNNRLAAGPPIFWAIVIIVVVGFLCGLVVVWIILKPLKEFIKNAKSFLPDVKDITQKAEGQIEEWEKVFRRVTTVLSLVDAKELFPDIIVESEIMRGVLSEVTKVAPTDSTVLILGESGTGKELVAASIYKQSKRKGKPFIKLNCVAIPDGLWESELFGHEKGAFTGATTQKIGKFELANGGTLFLDEIGDMPLNTQAKMLRVLQEREFERVGGNKTIKVDVRFIAATNKNLRAMVKEKKFREDLFFRLNVFTLHIPPLRERRNDIPALVEHFCERAPKKVRISPVAMQMLQENASWPGNIRELQNVIERAAVICEKGIIEPRHLPDSIVGSGMSSVVSAVAVDQEGNAGKDMSLDDQLTEIEKAMIIDALRRSKGVQVQAAKILGIKERSLWHRIKKHNIDAKSFKEKKAKT